MSILDNEDMKNLIERARKSETNFIPVTCAMLEKIWAEIRILEERIDGLKGLYDMADDAFSQLKKEKNQLESVILRLGKMDSMIEIIDGQECIAYIIPQIKGVKIYEDKKSIGIIINDAGVPNVHSFNSESGASDFYDVCLKKIEAYYKAMMLQKDDNQQDNADEIRIAHENENRANETASKLANFISMLCQQTMGDCEIAPTHLDDKMKRLEEWVTNKAKEGK